jgi:DNA invertase Pin-like site-specific DNA recombinase
MAKIGYARVSTHGQNDDSQVDDLTSYGVDKLFIDHGVSGKHASRPELDKALAYMREGDVLVITRLSRAMRSLHHLLDLVNGTKANNYEDGLKARGIGLVVVKQGIDTTTPQGRLVFHILASIDEFERELIVEGTRERLAAARARGRVGGRVGGRKAKLGRRQIELAQAMYAETGDDGKRRHTVADIAAEFGVSRQTIYRWLEPARRSLHSRERDDLVVLCS